MAITQTDERLTTEYTALCIRVAHASCDKTEGWLQLAISFVSTTPVQSRRPTMQWYHASLTVWRRQFLYIGGRGYLGVFTLSSPGSKLYHETTLLTSISVRLASSSVFFCRRHLSRLQSKQSHYCVATNVLQLRIYTINLPDAETLGGAYDGGGASPVGVQGHMVCCSGR